MSVKSRLAIALSAVLAVTSLSVAAVQAAPASPAKVSLGTTALGQVLVGPNGLTLYMFAKDSNGQSSCYDKCAFAWPPLLTTGAPMAGTGVNAALLGTTARADGATQVTYNGMPIYYWFLDAARGDVKGQGVGKIWYVLDAAGKINKQVVSYVGKSRSPLGDVLVGPNGKTLYMFKKDIANTSNCYGDCAVKWPPLLTDVKPQADKGVLAGALGTTKRTDGTLQVTYRGMPLYYWFQDNAAGDWNGQAVGKVWWMVSPNGVPIAKPLPVYAKLSSFTTVYGPILVGNNNRVVYMFTKDSVGKSVCYGKCAEIWPPVLTEVAPIAGAGVDAKLFGTFKRTDGKRQVTYKGMPLYYYFADKNPGELMGQNVNGVWFVLRPTGEALKPG